MTVVASVEDLHLVDAVRDGDEEAFAQLLERYHPMLRRLARIYVGSTAAAEELGHDTWLGVLDGIDRFDGRSTLRTWICQLLVRRARTGRRDRSAVPSSAVEDAGQDSFEGAVDPGRFGADGHWLAPPSAREDMAEDDFLAEAVVARARASVEALPPAQREVVTLRDIEGWTASEVCAVLAITDATQRCLLHRARSHVRGAIEACVARERVAGVAV
jgi:RNA polymerase sigma-70 factor, ECF subfamily